MTCFCIGLMGFALGMAACCMMYGWLEDRDDKYAGIVIPHVSTTSIEWSLRKEGIPDKYAVLPRKKIVRGHLGHMDHKAMGRYTTWIKDIQTQVLHHSPTSEEHI